MLEPVIARYRERGLDLYFRGDAAFAKPELYELLEAEGIGYAIRLAANQVLTGADRASADQTRWPAAEQAASVLRQLQLSGAELEQAAPRRGQDGVDGP